MKKKKGQYQRVWICWLDSVMRKTVWWNIKDILEDIEKYEKNEYFYSVGFLFKTTKLNYYLASSIHFEEDKAVAFGEIFTIPKGCVIEFKKI